MVSDNYLHKDCVFCNLIGNGKLAKQIQSKSGSGNVPCERHILDNEFCIAILAPEQFTPGHTLVILKRHRDDIADKTITEDEFSKFSETVRRISQILKDELKVERIYVCTLCDGVQHLHAHLIPRRHFTEDDEEKYREQFEKRDGIDNVRTQIEKRELGGFWYIAEREKNFKRSSFWVKGDVERAKDLQDLAKKIRKNHAAVLQTL